MIEKVSKVKQAVILACCLAVGGCKQAPQANVESGYKVMTLAPADRTLSSQKIWFATAHSYILH